MIIRSQPRMLLKTEQHLALNSDFVLYCFGLFLSFLSYSSRAVNLLHVCETAASLIPTDMAHDLREVAGGRFKQKMIVIVHQAIA